MKKTRFNNKTFSEVALEFIYRYSISGGPIKCRVVYKGNDQPDFVLIGSYNGTIKEEDIGDWLHRPVQVPSTGVRQDLNFRFPSTWQEIVEGPEGAINTINGICTTSGRYLELVD